MAGVDFNFYFKPNFCSLILLREFLRLAVMLVVSFFRSDLPI